MKKFFAFVLAVFMLMSLLPAGALAFSSSDYIIKWKVYIVDSDGKMLSLGALDSSGYTGYTNPGDSYSSRWFWEPYITTDWLNQNVYVSSTANFTAVNVWLYVKHPHDLWEYDETQYNFIGWSRTGSELTDPVAACRKTCSGLIAKAGFSTG